MKFTAVVQTRERLQDPALGPPASSTFFTADSAPRKPISLWDPSQNGLFTDPPQRQRENAGLPVRSYAVPLTSTNSIEPSGASTRYGPFGRTVILTVAMRPPIEICLKYEDNSFWLPASSRQQGKADSSGVRLPRNDDAEIVSYKKETEAKRQTP